MPNFWAFAVIVYATSGAKQALQALTRDEEAALIFRFQLGQHKAKRRDADSTAGVN